MSKILDGIRVIDLSQAYSGPFAAMQLADHGAEVIKVEPPGGEQTRGWGPRKNEYSAYYAYFNRNKKGIVLDLKTAEGKEVLRRLIAGADVVVENFKAGTFAKLGFSYDELKKIKPDIIYAQITGFGLEGPMSSRACYDIVAQAESGFMSLNGFAENDPVRVGTSVADAISGLYLAIGIAMALYKRAVTGEGSHIDVAMLDSLFALTEQASLAYTLNGVVMTRQGNRGKSNAPWGQYKAKDGFYVIACGTNKIWQSLAHALGLTDLENDPDYDQPYKRIKKFAYLEERINAVTMQMTVEEVEKTMLAAGVPFGRVNTIDQVLKIPQLEARNMFWKTFDPGLGCEFMTPGTPVKIEGEPDAQTKAAPLLSGDADEILALAGYRPDEIAVLKDKGVTV